MKQRIVLSVRQKRRKESGPNYTAPDLNKLEL